MSVPRSPHRRHSPLRGRAVPFAPASVPLVGFAGSVHQSPVFGDMVEEGTVVSMSVTDTVQT
jgi:hypothetical protein